MKICPTRRLCAKFGFFPTPEVVRFRSGCTVVIYASLSRWESRAEGPERATEPLVVEFNAGSEDPPRPLRGRPSRMREGEAKSLWPNGL